MRVLEPGTVIDGRYTIDVLLGRGGFAAVYKAHHRRLDKWVALKVLDLPDVPMDVEPFVKRFMREAQVSARIEHANIVSVFDYGVIEASSQPYIAMEFLEGHDLEEELKKNGPLDIDRFVKLFRPALDAIGDAHRNGVVHKDLKPSNLFVVHPGTPRERLVVLDFGIARFYEETESKLTQTGGFSGTPAYLAPEYIEQQIVTPRLDVYQMGLIGIEALIGRQVVQADNAMAYMLAHCSGDIALPEALLQTEIGLVLKRAISRRPEDRFENGDALSDALGGVKKSRTVIDAGGTAVNPPAASDQSFDSAEYAPAPSKHYYLIIGSLALLILIVGGAGLMIKFVKGNEVVAEPEPEVVETVELSQIDALLKEPEVVEEIPEAPTLHSVRINTIPRAEVFVGDQPIGITPVSHTFSVDEKVTVRIEADGFETAYAELDKDQKRVDFKLKKEVVPTKKVVRKKSRPSKKATISKVEKKTTTNKIEKKKKNKTEAIAW